MKNTTERTLQIRVAFLKTKQNRNARMRMVQNSVAIGSAEKTDEIDREFYSRIINQNQIVRCI